LRGSLRRGRAWRLPGGATVSLLAVMLVSSSAAVANTYRVNTTQDHGPRRCNRHDCTLREGVIAAVHHRGADRVILRSRRTYRLTRHGRDEDKGRTGDLDVKGGGRLVIVPNKRAPTTVDANQIDRALDVGGYTGDSPVVPLILKGVTIRGGNPMFNNQFTSASCQGGGILAYAGSLHLSRVVVRDNSASCGGGGIFTTRSLNVERSTIEDNSAGSVGGGGAGIKAFGDLTLKRSTVSGNTTGDNGGGLLFSSAPTHHTLTAVNSTIAGNGAHASGGGIMFAGNVTAHLSSVTIAYNEANQSNYVGVGGGGIKIFSGGPVVTLTNSLVALNSVHAGDQGPDCNGAVNGAGTNLLSDQSDCTITGGALILASDPMIVSLARNGGPTQTIALESGSPAIGQASNASPAVDQRGVDRDANPDNGAYEVVAGP
jgi:hypothetical protein